MAIVSGVVCVAAGLARLGFITELLSKPIRYGYMNGIAVTVILSQIPKLFGFSVSADGPLRQALGIVDKVWEGSTNVTVLAIGGSCLALILVLKRWPRLPGMLIAVAAATIVVAVFDLASGTGISVLGPLPQGLPAPRIPLAPLDSLVPILTRWPRGRARLLRRHQCALPNLRGASANTGRPEPGDGGPWPRERRGGVVSGLPDQQQFFAHTGRGGGWREDPVDGRRGRARDCAVAVVCAGAAPGSAEHRAGGDRHRVSDRADRSVRPAAASIASSAGSSGFR